MTESPANKSTSIVLSERQFFALMMIFSLLLHILVLIFNYDKSSKMDLSNQKLNKPIEVTSINSKELQRLQKIRTVGVKNGKDFFSMPLSPKSKQFGPKAKFSNDQSQKSQVDFKDLQVQKDVANKVRPIETNKPDSGDVSTNNKKIIEREEIPKEEIRKIEHKYFANQRPMRLTQAQVSNIPIAVQDAMLLEKTDFNIGISPPEGVSIDQLNSTEKMYYSFQKRIFESYVSSFLTSYQRMLVQRPLLKRDLGGSLHQMTGRIIFDAQGNIVSVKIIKSSLSDEVHLLFEQTLLNIRSMPNPPKTLLSKDGEFSIYYQLMIN